MKIKNQWDLKRNIKTERERKENQRGNWPVICVYEAVNGFPRWTGAIFHLNPLRSPTFLRRSNAWDLTHREVLELCRNFVDAGASRMFWSWSKMESFFQETLEDSFFEEPMRFPSSSFLCLPLGVGQLQKRPPFFIFFSASRTKRGPHERIIDAG